MEFPSKLSKWIRRWLLCIVIGYVSVVILIGLFICTNTILFFSLTAGVATFQIACCIVIFGDPADAEGTLPSKYTPDKSYRGLGSALTPGRNYAQVILGFALLSGILVASLVWRGGHAQLYLSAAPFYVAIGFYLFSQGNTIYSLAKDGNGSVLFETADQVTKSAYLIAIAAGGYFLLGVLVSQANFPYIESPYRRFISAFAGVIPQLFLFYGLRIHRVNHLWFQYVEKQQP